jgi:hypothetical protein
MVIRACAGIASMYELGIAKVPGRHPLVRQVGWQTRESEERRGSWAALDDPATRFYLTMNPRLPEGPRALDPPARDRGVRVLCGLDGAGINRITLADGGARRRGASLRR